jgi:hypothetical protein
MNSPGRLVEPMSRLVEATSRLVEATRRLGNVTRRLVDVTRRTFLDKVRPVASQRQRAHVKCAPTSAQAPEG